MNVIHGLCFLLGCAFSKTLIGKSVKTDLNRLYYSIAIRYIGFLSEC